MFVNPISKFNIIQPQSRIRNRFTSFRGLENDTFVKTAKTDTSENEQSYSALLGWAKETDFLNNARTIVEHEIQFLGSGFEGETYSIPNCDKWVLKKYNHGSISGYQCSQPELREIQDISPKVNVGQPIAQLLIPINSNYSSVYWILKKQTGHEYGVEYADAWKLTPLNEKIHMKSLRSLASLPQESFDKCLKDLKYITDIGYAIDYMNPNNIMIDAENQEIRFVDVNDKLQDGKKEQYIEVLYGMLDANFARNYNSSPEPMPCKQEAIELSKVIMEKYFNAMKNLGIEIKEDQLVKLDCLALN